MFVEGDEDGAAIAGAQHVGVEEFEGDEGNSERE